MKKVFYSEALNKYFDSEEECLRQELIAKQEADKHCLKSQEEKQVDSRKQAAKIVEEAQKAVSESYDEMRKAEERAREAYRKIVDPAKKKLEDAERNRLNAIQDFNKKFGVYTKRYTGQEARDEFLRTLDQIEDLYNIFNF